MKNKSNKNYSVQEDVINIQFTEIFELEDIQRLQDLFSDTQGIASVITDPDSKPITKPSKVCRLLQDLIRITEPKLAASFNIIRDKNNQTYLASEKRAGLLPDVLKSSVKIIVDNKHIANWTIVQMRSEGLNENQKINFCKEIGLNREDFSKALEEVPPMTVNQFDKVIRMLVEFSGEFSKNASSKLRIKKHIAELQHVNELLKEERQIFSQGNVVIFKWKNQENWPVEYVSPNVGQVFGYAPDEIQSPKFDFASLIHPEDLDRVSSEVSLNSSQHKDCFEHAPYRIISKNGKIHWISDYTIIQRNNERQIVSYIGYIIDITDRKETEETLRENENKFRTVADFTYDWEYWEDSKKKIIYISPSCKRITGYEPEEFLSDNMLLKKIVHPGDLEFLEGHFEKVHSVEHIHEIEELDFRIIKKDGSEAYVGHLCRPVFNDQGKYLGRRVSNREITDRKLAEEMLRASEENLRITLQSVADAVIVTDREGRVTRMNKVAESLTGWSIEEALNKPFCEIFYIINDDNLHIIANPVDIALKTGKTSGMANHAVFINRNKIEYQISESAAPIVDGNGNIKGVIFVFSDITEKYYAQKVIAESERNYREIFNSSTDAIFIHHKTTGAIIDINETMLRMYGYDDKSEIINGHL